MDGKVSPYDLPPIENARRQYVELFGSALVMNTYLKIAIAEKNRPMMRFVALAASRCVLKNAISASRLDAFDLRW